jgi:ATP-binding cassette subfamily F protein uup
VILLDATGLGASRPGRSLFEDLDLTVRSGERLGVVGLNGCGKSTLLGVLSGDIEADAGTVRRGRGVEVGALLQAPRLEGRTVREALHHESPVAPWEAESIADRLGLGELAQHEVAKLSGGQAKRVALARALVSGAELLILDEPTNHLDIDAVAWLEEHLASRPGALVLVTHDRHFLDAVTTDVLELDRGRAYRHFGGYTSYLEGRARREELAAQAESTRRNLARRELAWLRRGAPARTSKPKARIAAAERLVRGRPEAPARAGELPLHAITPRLGRRVIELHDVCHAFGEHVLFEGVDLAIDQRERLGIVGPNGTGKSTLLDIIAGRLAPSRGSVEHGDTVQVTVFDQQGRDLDPTLRVREVVVGPHRAADWADEELMASFWFDDDAQHAPVGMLSGGERRRLQLLVALNERPNVLLLDEPTNDLDLDTLRALEEMLEEWPGAVVVVSHDRAFLERVVSDVMVLGDGKAERRPGGYGAYEAERRLRRVKGRVAATGATTRDTDSPGAVTAARPTGSTGSTGSTEPGSAPAPMSPSTLRHRLRTAERDLERHRTRTAELGEAMEAAASGGRHAEMAELAAELAGAAEEMSSAEERWLDLAGQAEERGLAL